MASRTRFGRPFVARSGHESSSTRRHRVPITIIRLDSTRQMQNEPEDVQTVLEFFRKFLETYVLMSC